MHADDVDLASRIVTVENIRRKEILAVWGFNLIL